MKKIETIDLEFSDSLKHHLEVNEKNRQAMFDALQVKFKGCMKGCLKLGKFCTKPCGATFC